MFWVFMLFFFIKVVSDPVFFRWSICSPSMLRLDEHLAHGPVVDQESFRILLIWGSSSSEVPL